MSARGYALHRLLRYQLVFGCRAVAYYAVTSLVAGTNARHTIRGRREKNADGDRVSAVECVLEKSVRDFSANFVRDKFVSDGVNPPRAAPPDL